MSIIDSILVVFQRKENVTVLENRKTFNCTFIYKRLMQNGQINIVKSKHWLYVYYKICILVFSLFFVCLYLLF